MQESDHFKLILGIRIIYILIIVQIKRIEVITKKKEMLQLIKKLIVLFKDLMKKVIITNLLLIIIGY